MACKSNNVFSFAGRSRNQRCFDSTGMKTRLIAGLSYTLGGAALAGDPHTSGMKGQPSQPCEDSMVHPGKAALAPGSAFNDTTPGVASTRYATDRDNVG